MMLLFCIVHRYLVITVYVTLVMMSFVIRYDVVVIYH